MSRSELHAPLSPSAYAQGLQYLEQGNRLVLILTALAPYPSESTECLLRPLPRAHLPPIKVRHSPVWTIGAIQKYACLERAPSHKATPYEQLTSGEICSHLTGSAQNQGPQPWPAPEPQPHESASQLPAYMLTFQ